MNTAIAPTLSVEQSPILTETKHTKLAELPKMELNEEPQVDMLEEISNFMFVSKYAKYNEDLKRRETWDETVDRVLGMHLRKYNYLEDSYKEKIKNVFDLVRQKRVVPSMRSMQFGGVAIEQVNERMFNCSVRHIDSIRAFSEVFFLLMAGCGVGFGLTKKFLDRLPDLVTAEDKTGTVLAYQIEDTIQGWSDSVEALLSCYFRNTAFSGRKIVFDYSKIRRKGAKLKTSGGKAPGYKGLKAGHSKIKKLLDYIIEDSKQTRLKAINAYDILMHVADATLSGGIRRSATICIFDKTDDEMLNAKTGNWQEDNPQRARSNNSVLINRNTTSHNEFKSIIERTKKFGEPGFLFVNEDDSDVLTNPCGEIQFKPITEDGVCGVQFCNLTSINGAKINSKSEFIECIEAVAIIGTLQAGYTNFPYLSQAAKHLTENEALLGVSIIAMMEKPDILLNPEIQKEGANYAVKINEKWAKILRIRQAARVTCVKPDGNVAVTLGTMSSGIHPAHAHKMFRRIQAHEDENVLQIFKKVNPHLVERSKWSSNDTDDIVTFPVTVPDTAKVKADLSAIEHLEYIKSTQQNWVNAGSTAVNKKGINHSVSCTVIVKENEWERVIDYLFENNTFFSSVSFAPHSSDKDYKQAPMEAVSNEEDLNKFNLMLRKYKRVNYSDLTENYDETKMHEDISCGGGQCEVIYA